jgi:FdhD protein
MPRIAWRGRPETEDLRAVPEEIPVALTYNGTSHAVMMATPADLEDFATGFSLSECMIRDLAEIESLEIVELDEGIELRMRLAEPRIRQIRERRRRLAGPTGCGLCGIESLADALPRLPRINGDARFEPAHLLAALDQIASAQALHGATRAVHAAALWRSGDGLLAVREDVGRHNALDKLIGATARAGEPADASVLVLTSRVSVEMVQKAAMLGAPVMVAVSAPTALAIRTAEAAGITLVAVARSDGFEVFTHRHRIVLE